MKIADALFPGTMYALRIRRKEKEPEIRLLPALCRPDRVSLDVGANKGVYVWHLRPVSKRVIAFEPLPQLLDLLRARYGESITLEGIVLSDREGQSVLRYPKGNYAWATVAESNSLAMAAGTCIESVTVQMRTLDSFALTNIGFIKIDVEGHEEAVLSGGIRTIRQERPNLLIEIEERHSPQSLQRIHAVLGTHGYLGYYLDGSKILPLSNFDMARDQPLANISEKGKTGKYINNFMFFPQETAPAVVEAASAYL